MHPEKANVKKTTSKPEDREPARQKSAGSDVETAGLSPLEIEAQRMESLGAMTGGVVHKFNNMLMGMLGYTELIRQDLDENSEVDLLMGELEDTARRAAALTAQLLAYSGRRPPRSRFFDVSSLVGEMRPLLEAVLPRGVSLCVDLEKDPGVCEGDTRQITQVLVNLVTRSGDALGGGGEVHVKTGVADLSETDPVLFGGELDHDRVYVFLEVCDDGPESGDVEASGGLRLQVVQAIVRAHGGAIRVAGREKPGATVTALFPIVPDGVGKVHDPTG